MGDAQTDLLRRDPAVLRPDNSRVIAKLFLPGQELLAHGMSRAQTVLHRVVALDDDDVDRQLAGLRADFGPRHPDIDAIFAEHFGLVAHQLPAPAELSPARRALVGAFSTQEFAVEAAALFNPSMVAHPDQRGIAPGDLRFVMSARAVGEGHISSVVFRTGTITPGGVVVDEPGPVLGTGRTSASLVSREFVREALAKDGPDHADGVLRLLRRHFAVNHLDLAEQALLDQHQDALLASQRVIERIREIAGGHYRLTFAKSRAIAERVIYPTSAGERQGLEDVRLTRFVENNGTISYLGTYTAFDGSHVQPRRLRTKDFRVFEMAPLAGAAAKDKGMALFPRMIGDNHFALARWDRESLCLAVSDDGYVWDQLAVLAVPSRPWEVIQLGNCGPPIETPAGWLVLTHGVGAMRVYRIGALLLDLDDPSRVIASLDEPLLEPSADERNGYVPNVVYSCGALLHGETLVLPYGCSDSSIRFGYVDLPTLLDRLRPRDGVV